LSTLDDTCEIKKAEKLKVLLASIFIRSQALLNMYIDMGDKNNIIVNSCAKNIELQK